MTIDELNCLEKSQVIEANWNQNISCFSKIIDTKTGAIVMGRVSQYEAHRRLDLLNSSGIVRYKAVPR